jgi:hypothetical protein
VNENVKIQKLWDHLQKNPNSQIPSKEELIKVIIELDADTKVFYDKKKSV